MKTFSELAECLARIPPKITLYGLLFKYNYVGCLLPLIFSSDLLFAIKRGAYIKTKSRGYSWDKQVKKLATHHFRIDHNASCLPLFTHNHCFQFLLGITVVPREIEDNGYAKLGGGVNKVHYG